MIHGRVTGIFKASEADFYSQIHLRKPGNYCFNSSAIIGSQHLTGLDLKESCSDLAAAIAGAIASMTAAIHS